jgi:hypothetical protein
MITAFFKKKEESDQKLVRSTKILNVQSNSSIKLSMQISRSFYFYFPLKNEAAKKGNIAASFTDCE